MAVGGDISILGLDDVDDVVTELKQFPKRDWKKFGLTAGLSSNTLDEIGDNKKTVEDQFFECLSCWLRRKDKVDSKGKPSWKRLVEILQELGERALADKIIKSECSSEVVTEKSSETPQTQSSNFNNESQITIEDYDRLKEELLSFLLCAINDMSLDEIKLFLIGRNKKIEKMIEEVSDKTGMTGFCIDYFSLSNFIALKNLAVPCKPHIKEQFDDLLKKRNSFYENILAKDFAMKPIEDHNGKCGADATITFKVSWNQDEARLYEFETFLSTAFQSHKIYLRLRVVHKNPLKFVCSIASCLKVEITKYVIEKKTVLISEEVVEVTIDQDVIFNVEGGYAALLLYEPNDILKFTAVRSIHLAALLKNLQYSEVGLIHHFHFDKISGSIELKFDCNELQPTGWTIEPQPIDAPCKLYQDDVDKFNGTDGSVPQCCVISVCGSFGPNTEPVLHFPISLKGIKCDDSDHPVKLYIHRILESTIPDTPITSYIGLVYWERKEDKYLIGFVAAAATAKKFKSIVEFIENRHPSAIMKLVNFDFDSNSSYIKLSATFHEKSEPQLLSKEAIDNYNEVWHDPPFCQISLSPDAAQSTVQCSLSLKNATEPILNCKAPQTLDKNSYIGLIYYEWEKKEFLMTFLAGKKLAKIAQYIEKYCPLAEINQLFYFSFSSSHDFIELKFDCSQDESCKGWTVQPLVEPCRLYQNDIDEFSKTVSPVPPCCSVSVRGSPDAIPTLHYSIPLVGVANPVTLCIDRKLQLEKDILELFASHDTEISLEAFIENRRKVRSFFQGLAHQNKVLLNQALVEADKQAADDKFAMSKKLEDVSKKKESITEDNEKLQAQVADIEKEMEKIEEEKRKVEEDYFKIIKDLRAKVSDNELYTAKLMKEREQLQERVTSLEKQSIKETTCSSQFNYMIPSMDKLKCLSDALQVAERQLFLIEGDKPQLMNLKKYGLRIGVQEESLLSSETGEVAVVALAAAKGQFQFPANTVLVSDVYAVSLSKPLLKQLKLEIQYSIDLTGQPDFTQYLKFAIAPVSTPSLPYQFSIVEGGEFSSCSGYRFIQVNEPCLVCTLQDKSTNGGASVNGDTEEREEEKKEQQPHEKEEKQLLQGSDSFLLQHEEEGIQQQQVEELEDIEHGDVHQEVEGDQPHQEKENEAEEKDNKDQEGEQDDEEGNIKGGDDDDDKVQSTHARKVVTYAGLVYYEEKGVEDLVTFAVAKDLNTLYDFLKRSHEDAICGPNVYFQFDDGMDYIELCLNTPQKETPTGWTIQPHVKPCRLYRQDIYKFHEATCPVPPSCLVSVHASPGADPTLHYSVPLKGVADPVTLFIHASRKQRSPPTLTGPTTSSSNTIFEAIAVSSTGVASPSATVDVNKVKKVVHDVIVDTLKSLEVEAIPDLTDQLDKFNLINSAVRENPSMDKFVSEFKDILSCLKRLPQVQEHCQKFLSSFIAVRGSYAKVAETLHEDWTEAIRIQMGFDFNISINYCC